VKEIENNLVNISNRADMTYCACCLIYFGFLFIVSVSIDFLTKRKVAEKRARNKKAST
jgi:hypothetical protein